MNGRTLIGRQGISSDRSGHLFLATAGGLVVGDISKKEIAFRTFRTPETVKDGGVVSVYTDASGLVWFGCGLNLCRLENQSATEVGAANGLPLDRWDAIIGDLDGNLWVRSASALYLRAHGSSRFELQAGLPPSSNTFPILALD